MTDTEADLHLNTINRTTEIFRQTEWLRHEVESLQQELQTLHDDPDADDATKPKLEAELERWTRVAEELRQLEVYGKARAST